MGEFVVDNFAGGGGASTGIARALGRPVDMAINHHPAAIALHTANHPETKHYCEDIWQVDPREACAGRPVGLAWFSPDCTHFSRAKGTTPVKKEIRGLAWVVTRWAKAVRPRVIILENVEEFQTWGPLLGDRPDPQKSGHTFRAWLAQLKACGYEVEFRSLVAADFGAPTTRKRLYLVARCDGQPIVWPTQTHGKGQPLEWRTAAECIQWELPCPSIFERKRPLAEATMRRIAKGIDRYVVNNARPFIVPLTHQGERGVHGIDDPFRTITGAHRGELAYVEPYIVRHGHYSTITGAGLEEGKGCGTFRGQSLQQPLATVCATNDKHLVAPIITKHFGGPNGHPTPGSSIDEPLSTVTARDHHALSAAFLTKFQQNSTGQHPSEPMHTVMAGATRFGEVRAFLMKYHGGAPRNLSLFDPLRTVDTSNRFGVVFVHGEPYSIADIGMRMLAPRELYRAQGFPDSYQIDIQYNGKPLTKELQIKFAGNSVCPDVVAALVAANVRGSQAVAA